MLGFGVILCCEQEDMRKALLMILVTFYNRVSVSLFEDDYWQIFYRGMVFNLCRLLFFC